MSSGGQAAPGAAGLTLSGLLQQFLPLSLSDLIMALAGPIISAGLARLAALEVHLAAYGVTMAVAVLLESPIIMVLHASTALTRRPESGRALLRFVAWASLALTALHAAVAFTPAYDRVFGVLLGRPPYVAAAARPAFQAMLLWTPAIAWRRFFQGTLINRGRSALAGWASAYRMATLAGVVLLGALAEVALTPLRLALLYPLLTAAQNHLQGLLVQRGRTAAVNLAAAIGGALLLTLVFAGATGLRLPGSTVAAAAVTIGLGAELGMLWYASRRSATPEPNLLGGASSASSRPPPTQCGGR